MKQPQLLRAVPEGCNCLRVRGPQRRAGGPRLLPVAQGGPGLGEEETGGCSLQGLWGGREQVGEIPSMLRCCPSPLSGDSFCLVGPQGRGGGAELSCPPGTHLSSSSAANPRPGSPPTVPLSKGEANHHPAPPLPSSPTLDPQLTHTLIRGAGVRLLQEQSTREPGRCPARGQHRADAKEHDSNTAI